MALSLYTAPESEPLTLGEAKRQIHQEGLDDDDEWLEDIGIPAVRDRAEAETGRVFITQVWDQRLDRFPWWGWSGIDAFGFDERCGIYIEVGKAPLVSVESVTYVDQSGATQTWATSHYIVDAPAGPRCQRGRISLVYGAIWPIARAQMNAVSVRFTAGYGADGAFVPPLLKMAMLMDLATLYANRENIADRLRISEMPGRSVEIYRTFRSHSRKR